MFNLHYFLHITIWGQNMLKKYFSYFNIDNFFEHPNKFSRLDHIFSRSASFLLLLANTKTNTRGSEGGGVDSIDLGCSTPHLANNQTKIPYPKLLKHTNKTKLRLNERESNSLKIIFLIIKTHLLKKIFLICGQKYKIFVPTPISFCVIEMFPTPP